MSAPTTATYWNQTTPAPTSGDQTCVIQTDNATPQDSRTIVPKVATSTLRGTVKPDNVGITVASDGTISLTGVGLAIVSTACLVIDGGGSTPATGAKGFLQIPFAGTITGWTLLGDVSGSAAITVSKGTYAAFPTVASIVASAKPTLSSAQKATSTTLTGWTTSVAAGDILGFNLDSVTTCTRLFLELMILRS